MKDVLRRVILGISIVIVLLSVGYIIYYYVTLHNKAEVYEELQTEVRVETEEVTEQETEEPIEVEEEEEIIIPIDFDALYEVNSDVYAWIEIEDTNVSYPILQSATDDSYYLSHTIDGIAGLPGTIYTEAIGGTDFEVFNTVIYGHNMNDDSMFGGLNLYRDLDYMMEHEYIVIYTEDAIRTYQIFVVTTFSDAYLVYAYDFERTLDCAAFLEDIISYKSWDNVVRDDIEVTEEDRIITLSTCIGNMPDNRLLVGAVLIEEQTK